MTCVQMKVPSELILLNNRAQFSSEHHPPFIQFLSFAICDLQIYKLKM